MRKRLWVIPLAIIVFGLDRFFNGLVSTHMTIGESIPVLPPVLWITYITNSGAAFSILRHGTPIFIVVAFIILIALAIYVARAHEVSKTFLWGAGLLAGGTAGNLWDRMVAGRVVDYIHFRYWAIFNLADAAIVVGIGLIILDFWRKDRADAKAGN